MAAACRCALAPSVAHARPPLLPALQMFDVNVPLSEIDKAKLQQ